METEGRFTLWFFDLAPTPPELKQVLVNGPYQLTSNRWLCLQIHGHGNHEAQA